MIAPVAGSGSCPTWIARVSNSMRDRLRERVALEPEHAREPRRRPLEPVEQVAADARLGRETPDAEHSLGAVGLRVGAAEEPLPREERQHVVAVHALRLGLVALD